MKFSGSFQKAKLTQGINFTIQAYFVKMIDGHDTMVSNTTQGVSPSFLDKRVVSI